MTSSVSGWDAAVWIGALDLEDPPVAAEGVFVLEGGAGHPRARFLVRNGMRLRGFVEVEVRGEAVDAATLINRANQLPEGSAVAAPSEISPVSVVVCTRDRAELLAQALESLLELDHPDFEVVVVDNASRTTKTAEYVAGHPDPRVRLVTEPRPGLSRARNTGVAAARHQIIAFTDDDVVVDKLWLLALLAGFADDPATGLVCGLVPSGEIGSASQAWFDHRVKWSDATEARRYSLAAPPPGVPLFPFQVGLYGTGANFAVRRSLVLEIGGFDPALGVGTPTGGGEDLDIFVRVLASGATLAVEPAAVVWHRHRADLAALRVQARGYGIGLGAWLTKVLTTPALRRLALSRVRHGAVAIGRIFQISRGGSDDPNAVDRGFGLARGYTRSLGRLEFASMWAGPLRYLRSRRAARH